MPLKQLKKEAYKSPVKEFLLSLRYAAFSYLIPESNPPVSAPKEKWQSRIIDSDFAPNSIDCEYVVIGSGAGGAAVAYNLAAQGYAVLIVEEGNYYGRKDIPSTPAEAFRKLYRNSGFTFAWGRNPFPICCRF
jgi:NADPH-dependent 2,4-dienoyl-CoA reductase/sulfur reductase-like enzyme